MFGRPQSLGKLCNEERCVTKRGSGGSRSASRKTRAMMHRLQGQSSYKKPPKTLFLSSLSLISNLPLPIFVSSSLSRLHCARPFFDFDKNQTFTAK